MQRADDDVVHVYTVSPYDLDAAICDAGVTADTPPGVLPDVRVVLREVGQAWGLVRVRPEVASPTTLQVESSNAPGTTGIRTAPSEGMPTTSAVVGPGSVSHRASTGLETNGQPNANEVAERRYSYRSMVNARTW
ncbi:hypothetical protein ACVWWN_003407 [Mycobacterium sp. URHB0021]